MKPIVYIDRVTCERRTEEVYGAGALRLLYGDSLADRTVGRTVRELVARLSICSAVYGWWQKQPWTKSKIRPFVEKYGVDTSEFLEPVDSFESFNDFFIRELKPEARPIAEGTATAVIPADGRYYFYQELSTAPLLDVKGLRLDLATLLGDSSLAQAYAMGSLVMARLCPTDYHRFHFPVDCTPSSVRLINGALYSVNPIAIKQNLAIFSQNKRMFSMLQSEVFGDVLCIEVGATNVGSIHQTYISGYKQHKGTEKGYFSFGGSAMLLLFAPGRIQFDADLLAATQKGIEIRCLMGQSMGRARSG